MKFSEIQIGAWFVFQGRTYVKISPMIGRDESSGEQKFLRRSVDVSVNVEPRGGVTVKSEANARLLTPAEVAEAFTRFHAQCERCLRELAPQLDPRAVKDAQDQLAQARQRFLDTLT